MVLLVPPRGLSQLCDSSQSASINASMYIDDTTGWNCNSPNHAGSLAKFFVHRHLRELKLSPNKPPLGACRFEYLGHIVSSDDVQSNDDKAGALTRMPMPANIQ